MKKKLLRIIIILSAVVVVCVCAVKILTKIEFKLSPEYVCSISEELPDYSYAARHRWFTIKDEKYDSWAYYWGMNIQKSNNI